MYELTTFDWPYHFVTPDELVRFELDMLTYYRQLTHQTYPLPGIDAFAESPFPFFVTMMATRGEFDDSPETETLEYRSLRDTALYHDYQADILHYFAIGRFARRNLSAKGGGFSCLVS